jgi:hypothetical protein
MTHAKVVCLSVAGLLALGMVTATTAAAAIEVKTTKGGSIEIEGNVYKYDFDVEVIGSKSGAIMKTGGNTFSEMSSHGVLCSSAGAKLGEVKTVPLTEKLGYVNKAALEVGLEVKPTKAKELYAQFTCGEEAVQLRGGYIGAITPVNTPVGVGESLMELVRIEKGGQAITHFEGAKPVTLAGQINGGGFRPAAIEDTGEISPTEGTLEIQTTIKGPKFHKTKPKK